MIFGKTRYCYVLPQYRDLPKRQAIGYTWEDQGDSILYTAINGLSAEQQAQLRLNYQIPEGKSFLKRNPRTGNRFVQSDKPDRELGTLRFDWRVRNNPIKGTDMANQYLTKDCNVFVHPHQPSLEPAASRLQGTLELTTLHAFINRYIREPLDLPAQEQSNDTTSLYAHTRGIPQNHVTGLNIHTETQHVDRWLLLSISGSCYCVLIPILSHTPPDHG